MGIYVHPQYPYRKPDDLMTSPPPRRPLVVIGAGPVGLAAAIDARLHGLPVLVLDEDDTVSVGSRAVCYAKRALEVLDRLGVGEPVCQKGVSWNVGRNFFGEQEVYHFNLVPEPGHKRPGMINLQQYHLEEMMVARAGEVGADIRWKHKVVSVQPQADHVKLTVETPDGTFALEADWVICADGARSPVRHMLGLEIEGHVFQDRFLIADVIMKADFPAERWFWFDPPFHRGQSVLLHKQSDNVWRIDFQLGWQADPEEAKKPENVIPLVQAMLGPDKPFELEWVSVYTFQCRRMKDFRAGRVLFVGDAAHQVSPFGARGANSGFQDTDDLLWKLALVMAGKAPERLLDSYSADRTYAADENILNSTRSTDFITPKTRASKAFRNAALDLARDHAFARKLVNSGRLSVPSFLVQSALNTPDEDRGANAFAGDMVPGAPMDDAPVGVFGSGRSSAGGSADGQVGGEKGGQKGGDKGSQKGAEVGAQGNAQRSAQASASTTGLAAAQPGWLLDQVGNRFQLLLCADKTTDLAPQLAALQPLAADPIGVETLVVALGDADAASLAAALPGTRVLADAQGLIAKRYDARPGTAYLLRPDQHVAARWRRADARQIRAAVARATAQG